MEDKGWSPYSYYNRQERPFETLFDRIEHLRYKDSDIDWVNYIYRHGMERRKIYKEEKFPYEVQNIKF